MIAAAAAQPGTGSIQHSTGIFELREPWYGVCKHQLARVRN
jgi:hypothetical protein